MQLKSEQKTHCCSAQDLIYPLLAPFPLNKGTISWFKKRKGALVVCSIQESMNF